MGVIKNPSSLMISFIALSLVYYNLSLLQRYDLLSYSFLGQGGYKVSDDISQDV